MATPTFFNSFKEKLPEKAHNLESDVFRVALSNTAPTATDTIYNVAGLHPAPATAGGYNTNGATTAVSSSWQAAGTYKWLLADVVFTATTSIGPFRYVIVYDDTATNDELVMWYDYGSSITLGAGETFTVDFDATNGTIQLS